MHPLLTPVKHHQKTHEKPMKKPRNNHELIAILVAHLRSTHFLKKAPPVRSKSNNFWEKRVKHNPFCLAPGQCLFFGFLKWGTSLKSIQHWRFWNFEPGKAIGFEILHVKETNTFRILVSIWNKERNMATYGRPRLWQNSKTTGLQVQVEQNGELTSKSFAYCMWQTNSRPRCLK